MIKKILLTGVTGFLGSHLAEVLLNNGYEVVALKRVSSSVARLDSVASKIKFVDVDHLLLDDLFVRFADIDGIIHTATCYGRNAESVTEIFNSNTVFPLQLLDAGSRAGVKVFINTDTILDKYLNLYALSKNQLLQWGTFFSLHNRIKFINLRLEHFYGPRDDPTKFTTYVIDSCLANIPEIRLTRGEQERDFIYIDDVTAAYIAILENTNEFDKAFIEFDVGTGKPTSIRAFVETVHRLTAARTRLAFGAVPYREGEVMHSAADISGLTALGWYCHYDLTAGLKRVIEQEKTKQ
jgi:CDP-paratose synthetase